MIVHEVKSILCLKIYCIIVLDYDDDDCETSYKCILSSVTLFGVIYSVLHYGTRETCFLSLWCWN